MLLEDNPNDAMLVKRELERSDIDFETEECKSKGDFERLLDSFVPDIILSDINLPNYSGYEALNTLVDKQFLSPLIFVTGSLASRKAIDILKKGALDIVFKDHLEALMPAISRAITLAKERKANAKLEALNQMMSTVADIGGWEYNVATGESSWTEKVGEIYELGSGAMLPAEEAILYYKEGWSRDLIVKCFREAIEKGIPYDEEFLLITAKDNEKWVRSKGVPEIVNGKCVRVYGTFQDITDKKKAQLFQQKLAKRHEAVLNASMVGTWDLDVATGKVIIDENIANVLGHELSELATLNKEGEYEADAEALAALIHPEDYATVEKANQMHLSGGADNFDVEYRIVAKNGEIKWIHSKGKVVARSEDNFPTKVLGSQTDVTDKYENRNTFEALFMHSPLAKLVYDPKTFETITVNHEACRLYGYTPEEFKAMPVYELRRNASREVFGAMAKRMLEGHLNKNVITHHHTKEGKELALEANDTIMRYQGRDVAIASFKDVTNEIEKTKEIEKLSLVASKSTNGVVITDKDEKIEWVNAGFEKLTGYSFGEIKGKKPSEFSYGKETLEEHKKILKNAIKKGQVAYTEIINYHKDGNTYWVEIFLDVVKDEKGEVVNFILTQNNISERKKNEEELRKSKQIAEKALDELKHQKFALDEHSIVAVTDVKGTIEYVNGKFCEISKYSSEELIGRNHRILNSGYHPSSFFQDMYKTISNGQAWNGEIKNKAKDGSYYWVRTTIAPFLDKVSGKPLKYIAIRTEITAQKEAEEQLKETLENLELLVEQRSSELKAAKEELEEAHKDLVDSISYAKRIQQAILPSELELKSHFKQVELLLLPRDIVSGDFFWVEQIEGQKQVILAMADCTGHGVPGAFMSLVGKELLDQVIFDEEVYSPDKILEQLDIAITRLLKRQDARLAINDGMDISICHIDHGSQTLLYSGAQSHGLFYDSTAKELIRLIPDKNSIGGFFSSLNEQKQFSLTELKFNPGDRLFLFTDGYYDQWGGELHKKFLRKRFYKLIEDTMHLPLKKQQEKIESAFYEWKGKEMQVDDITVIAIEL